MDLCAGLLFLGFILLVVAIVGHGLWLLGAALGRALFGVPERLPRDAVRPATFGRRRRCPRCGTMYAAVLEACPSCGLDPAGTEARELRDLEITARQIQALVDSGDLEQALAEQFYRAIEARQEKLLGVRAERHEPTPATSPAAAQAPAQADETPAPAVSPVVNQDVPVSPPPLPSAWPRAQEPLPPRRSWGQMLGGFMEERNILWGELVGGLLIVGCSIALVISLWRTLEQIPYFPFLIFAAITGALFAAGFYTLSHWKLEATSRGLLVIATLLTPLDFLVLAGLSRGREAGFFDWSAEFLAVAVFSALVLRSARILMKDLARAEPLLTLAVVAVSASQLLVPRWLDAAEGVVALFVLLSLAPVVVHAGALGWVLLGARDSLDGARANQLFLFLGMSTFAVAVALGFIVYWSDEPIRTVQNLAVPIAVAACPLLIAGALVENRLRGTAPSAELVTHGLSPAVACLVGTIIVLAASVALLGALALGWPRPVALVVIGFLNAAVFAGVALGLRLPYMHAPALFCLAAGFLTLFHALRGAVAVPDADLGPRLLSLAIAPASGSALALLALLLAASSEWLVRAGRSGDGKCHIAGAGILAGLALILVARGGAAEPVRAFLVFSACGLAGLVVNVRWRLPQLTVTALLIGLGAVAYAIRAVAPEMPPARLWLLALLIQASFAVVGGLALKGMLGRLSGEDRAQAEALDAALAVPLRTTGLTLSLLAFLPLLTATTWSELPFCAMACVWLAALYFAQAWQEQSPGWFAACQATMTFALLYQVTDWLHGQEWVTRAERLLHPWSLQAYMVGLAGLGVSWLLARRVLQGNARARTLLEPPWPALDRCVLAAVVIANLLLVVHAVVPEVLREVVPAGGQGEVHRLIVHFSVLDLSMGWTLLILLALLLAAGLWERARHYALLGLVVLALTAVAVAAMHFRHDQAVASALRWGLAVLFLGISSILWARRKLWPWCERLGISWTTPLNIPRWSRVLLLAGTVAPILLITAMVAVVGSYGHRPAGPVPGTWFAELGWVTSMVVPLLVLVFALAGHGVREDAAGFIFAAGLILLTTVMGGRALGVVRATGQLAAAEGAYLIQLGILTASLWGLFWLYSGRWRNGVLLGLQATLCLAGNFVLLAPALVMVLWNGGALAEIGAQAARLPGWLAMATTLALGLWVVRLWAPRLAVHTLGCGGVAAGVLAAAVAADSAGWRGYHVLTLAWTVLALTMLAAAWVGSQLGALGPVFWSAERRAAAADLVRQLFPVGPARRWVETLSVCVVLLALGGTWGDPARPYWSSLATLAVSVLLGAMAVWTRRPGYVYASGLLINVVAFVVWQAWLVDHWGIVVWFVLGPEVFDGFLLLQILALAASSAAWSLVERRLRRLEPPVDVRSGVIPFAHAAVLLAYALLSILFLAALTSDFFVLDVHLRGPHPWGVVAMTGLALILCFWDPEAQAWGLPTAPLYGLGLLSIALLLHQAELPPRELAWWATLLLGGYLAGVSLLVRVAPSCSRQVRGLKVPPRTLGWLAGWYLPAQALPGVLVLGCSLWICLDFETRLERLGGPLAVTFLMLAAWLATQCWHRLVEGYSLPLTWNCAAYVTLSLGILAGVQASWALLDPEMAAPWLHRNVLALAMLLLAGSVYGLALPRLMPPGNPWALSGQRMTREVAKLAGLVLAVVLVQEFLLYDPAANVRRTPMALPAVLLVAALLAALIAIQLRIAIVRGNPLALSDRGRVWLVWGAELMVVVCLLHLRLNFPDIFPSILGRNWPLVLMTLGFVGVGLAELFRRRGLPVLAEPLQRTGLFLPLVPLLAFLVRPFADLEPLRAAIPGLDPLFRYLDRLPQHFAMHALLWFLLAALYALAAVLRRASWLGLLAALAANFGLWVILAHQEDLAFLLHPQIWLIPVGLILLAAEFVHRDRLTPPQAQGVRDLGLLVIYVSSTADMFITGLSNSVLLPIVLALLSIAGVLAGILLRVRAFLFLGLAFLFLVVFAQIWHAAVDRHQTWIWWASGIVLGAAILTLFALFEKRRNDVLKVLEEIKRWR